MAEMIRVTEKAWIRLNEEAASLRGEVERLRAASEEYRSQRDVEAFAGDRMSRRIDELRPRVAALKKALEGLVGDEPPISDLTVWPWAGCSYCYGAHFSSAYDRALLTHARDEREYTRFRDPLPGEIEYAPTTEHTADCPWASAHAALAADAQDDEGEQR